MDETTIYEGVDAMHTEALLLDALRRRAALAEAEEAAKTARQMAEDEIRDLLGDREKVEIGEWSVSHTSTQNHDVDVERLRADHPEILAAFLVPDRAALKRAKLPQLAPYISSTPAGRRLTIRRRKE